MRINAFYPAKGKIRILSIFAYSTRGVPGIEIKGIGRQSTLLKEKVIYLTRLNQIKIPLRRYVLCIDLPAKSGLDNENVKWLELPVLILLWYMLGVIPISRLEDCFVAGSVASNGKIIPLKIKDDDLVCLGQILKYSYQMDMKFLTSEKKCRSDNGVFIIPLEKILAGKNVKIKS